MNIQNFLVNATPLQVYPAAQTSASANSAAADVALAEGSAIAVLDVKAVSGTSPTLDCKFQSSADGSTGWADIPGAAATQVTTVSGIQKIPLDIQAEKRYIRAVLTLAGTSPVYGVSVSLIYQKKYA